MAVFTLRELSFSYPNSDHKALDKVNIAIDQGEFITLVGPTGSGKSTLLRLLKPELMQNGEMTGEILFHEKPINALDARESAAKIGYVAQHPEEQIVTDKVWHELAFTLENLGKKQSEIARSVAETAAYFGITPWYRQDTAALSGGQKQLLNLASAMTAQPDVLILDEPTSQLDPISASRFIETLRKLNRETGVTVIITEHRAEELIPISDRLILLNHGKLVYDDSPKNIAERLTSDSPHLPYLPTASQLFIQSGGKDETPLSVREGRRYLQTHFTPQSGADLSLNPKQESATALELKNVFFRYEKTSPDILNGLSMTVRKGEVFAILGANGCGKSTAASVIAGLRKPLSGTLRLFGKPLKDYKNGTLYKDNLSLLPQDVESVFIRSTVREELKGCEAVLEKLPFDLSPLFDRHPYDLSGGERQLVALCKALSTNPRLLILDEPSKGLDPVSKQRLANLILQLKNDGMTLLIVSHDVSFAALCADRCALFFDGALAATENTADFMNGNRYYTTAASRITRGIFDNAYTVPLAIERMKGGAQ